VNSIGTNLRKKIVTICAMSNELSILARKTLRGESPNEMVDHPAEMS
jgi:hypothetical protein